MRSCKQGDGNNSSSALVNELLHHKTRSYSCRFIANGPTTSAARFASTIHGLSSEAVTGVLPSTERKSASRLSARSKPSECCCRHRHASPEGINLQEHFYGRSFITYDLALNPTRTTAWGAVDPFGHNRILVLKVPHSLTSGVPGTRYDASVLDVPPARRNAIRTLSESSVPVPVDSNAVVEAILEGASYCATGGTALDRRPARSDGRSGTGFPFHAEWQQPAEREKALTQSLPRHHQGRRVARYSTRPRRTLRRDVRLLTSTFPPARSGLSAASNPSCSAR